MYLPMVLHMVFAHGFGNDGFFPWYFVDMVKGTTIMFYSRVNGFGFMNSSTCIYMYSNIERNIIKNKSGSLGFGIQGKISVYICFMFSSLTSVYFMFLRFICK